MSNCGGACSGRLSATCHVRQVAFLLVLGLVLSSLMCPQDNLLVGWSSQDKLLVLVFVLVGWSSQDKLWVNFWIYFGHIFGLVSPLLGQSQTTIMDAC